MNEVTGQTQYQTPITRKNGKLRRNGPIENISAVRRRARMHIDQGAVTDDYTADRNVAFGLLNDALATELVCVIRYKRHHIIAMRLKTEPAAPRSLQYANEEQAHREVVAARIVQLGSEPDFSPERLADRSNSQYAAGNSLYELMCEDLVDERVAIDTSGQIIRYFGIDDSMTRRTLEETLANPEEYADYLAGTLNGAVS